MTAQSVRSSGWRRPQPAEGSESRRRGEIYKALHTLVLPKKKASHARRMGRSTHRAEKQVILAKHRSSHEALGTTDRLARPADHLRVLLRVRRRTPSPVRAQGSRCKDQSAAHRGWALRLALHAAHRPRLASQASVQRQSPSTALRWGAMQQTCTHAGLLNFALHDCSVGGGARRRHSPLALGSALGRRRPGAAGRPGTRRAARRGSGGCTGSRGPGLAAAREGAGRGARQRRGRTPAACRARAGGGGGWLGWGWVARALRRRQPCACSTETPRASRCLGRGETEAPGVGRQRCQRLGVGRQRAPRAKCAGGGGGGRATARSPFGHPRRPAPGGCEGLWVCRILEIPRSPRRLSARGNAQRTSGRRGHAHDGLVPCSALQVLRPAAAQESSPRGRRAAGRHLGTRGAPVCAPSPA